jgi:hypothetical protein
MAAGGFVKVVLLRDTKYQERLMGVTISIDATLLCIFSRLSMAASTRAKPWFDVGLKDRRRRHCQRTIAAPLVAVFQRRLQQLQSTGESHTL